MRRKQQMVACRGGHSADTVTYPMAGETENASHTENLTLPVTGPLPAIKFMIARGVCRLMQILINNKIYFVSPVRPERRNHLVGASPTRAMVGWPGS
jgi:hypothetical protein